MSFLLFFFFCFGARGSELDEVCVMVRALAMRLTFRTFLTLGEPGGGRWVGGWEQRQFSFRDPEVFGR